MRNRGMVGTLVASSVLLACSLEVTAVYPGDGDVVPDGGPIDTGPRLDGNLDGTIPDGGPPPPEAPRSMSANLSRTCVVDGGGRLFCWGRNPLGIDASNSDTPVRVRDDLVFSQVSTGSDHTCAVTRDNDLWCWGLGNDGRLGVGNTSTSYTPVQVGASEWAQVAAGGEHTCARKTSGQIFCWGKNDKGQLGGGTTGGRQDSPVEVTGGGQYMDVTAGVGFTCAILTSGGLECWGDNEDGQAGHNPAGGAQSAPNRVGPNLDWREVEAGPTEACGLRGTQLYCWGKNPDDFLNLLASGLPTPTIAAASTPVASFSIGRQSICVVVTGSGDVQCWGLNTYGQLGQGDMMLRTNPTSVATGAAQHIAVGYQHACAGERGRGLSCWGANAIGELGIGTTSMMEASPVAVTLP